MGKIQGANNQTQELIEEFEASRENIPSLGQHRKFIRHVELKNGVMAEVRLEVVSIESLFMRKIGF